VRRRVDRWYAGYAFDLDGTVYLGDHLLPDAAEVIRRIRERHARVVFVTNKPLETAADYAAKLRRLGIEAVEHDVVTALDSLFVYLAEHHRAATVLPVAEPLVAELLAGHGFATTADPARASVVVASFDRTFDYAKLNAAYRAIKLHGAVLVGTNPDPYCPTPEGGLPDCAAIVAAIEACTGARAEAVLGKPSAHMARAVLSRLGVDANDAIFTGDRLLTDVALARSEGIAAALVLTGATTMADIEGAEEKPDFLLDGLRALIPG